MGIRPVNRRVVYGSLEDYLPDIRTVNRRGV